MTKMTPAEKWAKQKPIYGRGGTKDRVEYYRLRHLNDTPENLEKKRVRSREYQRQKRLKQKA